MEASDDGKADLLRSWMIQIRFRGKEIQLNTFVVMAPKVSTA